MASSTTWKSWKPTGARDSSPPRPCFESHPDVDDPKVANRLGHGINVQKRKHDAIAVRRSNANGRNGRFGGYSGAMDALASTALASGNSALSQQHRTSASAAERGGERPSKRVRSERLWPTPAQNGLRRPTTSYEPTSPKVEDAELLLFLSKGNVTPSKPASSSHYRSASFGARPSFIESPTHHASNTTLPQYQSAYDKLGSPSHQPSTPNAFSNGSQPQVKTIETSGSVNRDMMAPPLLANRAQQQESLASTYEQEEKGKEQQSADGETQSDGLGKGKAINLPEAEKQEEAPLVAPDVSLNKTQADNAASKGEDAGLSTAAHATLNDDSRSSKGSEHKAETSVKREHTANTKENTDPVSAPKDLAKEPGTTGTKGNGDIQKRSAIDDVPQVCAACNFHRNTLTLETENEATSWISCDGCNKWFHFACAGFKTMREVRSVDKFRCKDCKSVHGPTTYVRKSARAHAPIDYAELNQGVVKTSEESPEHHYIKPIKEGSIKFTPESFARIRPELVTSDFWLRGEGMKEPVVIPSEWNPRPRRIPRPEDAPEDTLEDPADDAELHDQSALESDMADHFECEQVPDEGQDLLDMVIPQDLTVRRVAELYGPEEKIEVIDVKSQNGEDKRWNMRKWTDYYESTAPNKPVRNVISLEVSQSKLGRLIRRPRVVRELDLQDSVWPSELTAKGDFPKVQFYCLMSVADCYTDFHIDFGGSSVYYHILKGKKTFFFIPPTDANLKKYEDWCNSEAQNYTFLGDQTKVCYRVDLGPGDTMLIPAGWIHAVWTPEDSLVIGGNFLTRQNYSMQIRVTQVEKATKVPKKFRYPHFQKIMWYSMIRYLSEDPLPQSVMDILLSGKTFERKTPVWDDYDVETSDEEHKSPAAPGSEQYNARYYAKCELDGLPELVRYLQRTAYIVAGYVTDGVSSDTKRAVQRSIPRDHKQHGSEPVDCVRKFAMWCAWKRGNEYLPHWVYPDHVPEVNAPEVTQKKLSAAHIRRLEREAAMSAQRVSDRPQREKKPPSNLYNEMMAAAEQEKTKTTKAGSPSSVGTHAIKQEHTVMELDAANGSTSPSVKKEGGQSSRRRKSNAASTSRQPACETCRKGRRACKHRELPGYDTSNGDAAPTPTAPMAPSQTKIDGDEEEEEEDVDTLMDGVDMPNAAEVAVDDFLTSPDASAPVNAASSNGAQSASSPNKDAATTPGRTKACADCRKSKRRCVHDEYGRQDPIKMAQAAQPRPAAKKKRDSDAGSDPQLKKLKKPLSLAESSQAPPAAVGIPTAPMGSSVVQPATQQPTPIMPSETLSQADEDSTGAPNLTENGDVAAAPTATQNTDDSVPGSSSALVSPPDSTHTDHERTVSPTHSTKPSNEETEKRRELTPPTTASEPPRSRRASQLPVSKPGILMPNSPAQVRSRAMSTASADSSKLGHVKQAGNAVSNDTDEDTMKLIHELMAEDRGLRARRESRPA